MIAVPGAADAKPPGSCEPWPECKDGDDGSGEAPAFSENCQNLNQWTVTGNWSVSRGECSAKNTDAEHIMVTTSNIDLSGALEAHLSYKYRIENADVGEYMSISVSSDSGTNFTDLKDYFGSESGTVSLNLADLGVALTSAVKLRATCFVSANNEVCAWDNIKIESVSSPPGELLVTINSPKARTYAAADFPLTYNVSLSQMGTAEYSLNDGPHVPMTSDEGSSGTVHTAVENALSNGSYSFRVFAIDDMGNSNDTQSVIFNVDTLAPAVEFVDPTPVGGSTQSSSEIPVKLSTNAGSDHYSFVDFDSDLFLWIRMEEVVGDYVIDSSFYQNDGRVEGDAFPNPNGKFGSAFEFDGINHGGGIPTDRIVIPGFQDRHPIFDTSFTAMAWAKPDINEKMVIIGTKSITNLPGWHLRTSGGNHRLRMGVNTGFTTETAAFAEARVPMEAGVWVHVVGTYDHTVPSIQLYLDGELIDTTTDGVSSLGYGNDLELAVAVPEDPQKAWDGLVDEVLIFNRVLDANEIKAIYDSVAHQFQNTYQGLGSGVHTFVGYSVNSAGDDDQTEIRDVTIN
jgi:hypothetical protein